MVKSKTRRDAEILVRNPSPRLFGEKFRDSRKVNIYCAWAVNIYCAWAVNIYCAWAVNIYCAWAVILRYPFALRVISDILWSSSF